MPDLGKLNLGKEVPDSPYLQNLDKGLEDFSGALLAIINKGLRFEDNHDISFVTITTDATPGTETAGAHTLGRTPTGRFICSQDKAAHIYDGDTSNDSDNIYIKSDTASVTVKVMVF